MTPHAGEGVNTAMTDALNLADAILRTVKGGKRLEALDKEIKVFEEEMFVRAGKIAKHSWLNTEDMFFIPRAPDSIIARYVRRAVSDHWIMRVLVPLWFVRAVIRIVWWW